MANIILFTDRTPTNIEINGKNCQFERFSRPAGAYKIASTLRRQGYSVLIVPNSLRLSLKAVKDFITDNSKDLIWVGISTTFMTVRSANIEEYRDVWLHTQEQFVDLSILNNNHYIHGSATQLAWSQLELSILSDFLKTTFNAKLVLGGTWITHIKNGAMQLQNDDNIHFVTGLAEDYTVELTKSLENNQRPPFQLASMEEADFKSSSIVYTDNDFIDKDEWLMLEVSRGCAFKCAYCVYDHKGKEDTTKHVTALRNEIIKNYEMWGTTKYHLLDDLYNDSDYKIKLLYDEVWSKLPFKPEWISYLRLDLIWSNPESAKWLEASGCRLGSFGIETLHDVAGKKVGKGLGKARILETLEMLKDTWGDRVLVNALMIAGLPYEPYDHIVETMDWLHTTDLIFSYKYNPLWVTPPDHKSFVLKQNDMSQDYEKYEITWGPDGWVNNVGVTYKMVAELVADEERKFYNRLFPVDLHEYPDLRLSGYTHKQLASRTFNSQILHDVSDNNYLINNRIEQRLRKILTIRD
jgi:sulfatase maturation enzyme AslB (radical SAM superfamily)